MFPVKTFSTSKTKPNFKYCKEKKPKPNAFARDMTKQGKSCSNHGDGVITFLRSSGNHPLSEHYDKNE